ncbi:hypothetical protein C8J27_106180 [Rhodobacter aestuarii]|uniref:Uncharacterized protein n=1 Tax=Rhodobacter aestuarii TaxID=453582 RepID=A0A1N7M860_9RHOB|nr:hypothetical protein [Rhodobacter aestuarii]PTV94911.1 hypothetical protein C8J27_106180 [Rhodobacter aestuarii]SIS82270.1 hypothetical protein SAMN05421580_105180 [Rhodobacter aestuarii]
MDSAEQLAGARRVKDLLIAPLERRGLAKPVSLTRAQYEAMVEDLCERLAYMSPQSLAALEEQVAAAPAGKDKDRLPIANMILEWAAQIQPPEDSASPLMRAVFSHALGLGAIAEGWGPELLADLRKNRRWPTPFVVKGLREAGAEALRRLTILEERMATGREQPPEALRWRELRKMAEAKCRDIAAMARHEGAA